MCLPKWSHCMTSEASGTRMGSFIFPSTPGIYYIAIFTTLPSCGFIMKWTKTFDFGRMKDDSCYIWRETIICPLMDKKFIHQLQRYIFVATAWWPEEWSAISLCSVIAFMCYHFKNVCAQYKRSPPCAVLRNTIGEKSVLRTHERLFKGKT